MTTTELLIEGIDWMGTLVVDDILVFGKWLLGIILALWVMRWFYRSWKRVGARPSKPGFFGKLTGAPWLMTWQTINGPFQFIAHNRLLLMVIAFIIGGIHGYGAATGFANWLIPNGGTTGMDALSFRLAFYGTWIGGIAIYCVAVRIACWLCQKRYGTHPHR